MKDIVAAAREVLKLHPTGVHHTPEQNRALIHLRESLGSMDAVALLELSDSVTAVESRVSALEVWQSNQEQLNHHAEIGMLKDEIERLERLIHNRTD